MFQAFSDAAILPPFYEFRCALPLLFRVRTQIHQYTSLMRLETLEKLLDQSFLKNGLQDPKAKAILLTVRYAALTLVVGIRYCPIRIFCKCEAIRLEIHCA